MTSYGRAVPYINKRFATLGIANYLGTQPALSDWINNPDKITDLNDSYPVVESVGSYSSFKVTDSGNSKNEGIIFTDHLESLTPTLGNEVLAKIEFDLKFSVSGCLGIIAGLQKVSWYSQTVIGAKCGVMFNTSNNTLIALVEDNGGTPYPIQWYGTAGTYRALIGSQTPVSVSGYSPTAKNTYTFLITMSEGTYEGIRVGFLINKKLKGVLEFGSDSSVVFMEDGIHPFASLIGSGYFELHGLRCTR